MFEDDEPYPDPGPIRRNKRATPRQATSEVAWEFEPAVFAEDDPVLDFAPYLHKQPSRNSITPDLQRAFVLRLAETGIVTSAAAHIGRSMEALYKLRKQPGAKDFARAWDEALRWGVLRLEDCALERALSDAPYNPHANSMLCFVLRYRGQYRVDARDLVPGHPIYEWIREDVLEEEREKRRGSGRKKGG
ncbi:MAG: hypothetical protein O9266_08285 [Porphyrobacter sp.]|jgi:hypothetical protein|nr:hypothetical protein [Porphyrobacter sp.]